MVVRMIMVNTLFVAVVLLPINFPNAKLLMVEMINPILNLQMGMEEKQNVTESYFVTVDQIKKPRLQDFCKHISTSFFLSIGSFANTFLLPMLL